MNNTIENTLPVEGWVCDGDVYCSDCIGYNEARGCYHDDTSYEGVSGSPTHCVGCGVPIIHELTIDGVELVCHPQLE